jgi:hypothetical protein
MLVFKNPKGVSWGANYILFSGWLLKANSMVMLLLEFSIVLSQSEPLLLLVNGLDSLGFS